MGLFDRAIHILGINSVYEEAVTNSLKLPDVPQSASKHKHNHVHFPDEEQKPLVATIGVHEEEMTEENIESNIACGVINSAGSAVTMTATTTESLVPPAVSTSLVADLEEMVDDDVITPLPDHMGIHHFKNNEDDQDEHHIHEETYHFAFGTAVPLNQQKGDNTISKIEGPGKLLKAKTSSELLSLVNGTVLEDQEKIASFINQLKAGEVQTKQQSDFRQRRLTYDKETKSDDFDTNAALVISSVVSPPPKVAPKLPTKLARSRTSIFASAEIGVVHQKKPPFPDDVLGTYSCHGIEPAPDEVDGIHEKINQDRGCVVYPYNGSKQEVLFMVLDGHGEQGDKVSEFVMRQVIFILVYLFNLFSST
jgi:hypothetical protein